MMALSLRLHNISYLSIIFASEIRIIVHSAQSKIMFSLVHHKRHYVYNTVFTFTSRTQVNDKISKLKLQVLQNYSI